MKKLFLIMMCILTCCVVVSSCSQPDKEETKQSSESKSKKKSKKKKSEKKKEESKESKEETKKGQEAAANMENSSEKEELKALLVQELDDFLGSDYAVIQADNVWDGENSILHVQARAKIEDGTVIYSSISNDSQTNNSMSIMTDGELTYGSYEDTPGWGRTNEEDLRTVGLVTDSIYINQIRFIYAALDAGLEYSYISVSGHDTYYIIANEEIAEELDLKAIDEKLENADKLAQYERYLAIDEMGLKDYSKEKGVVSKQYIFLFNEGNLVITEVFKNSADEEIQHFLIQREKSEETEENKSSLIEKFNRIKSTDPAIK